MTVTQDTWVEINGVDLATHAWLITDLSDLLNTPDARGSNEVMPGASGRRFFRRFRDELDVVFPMSIFGDFDEDGNPIADPVQGVIDHVEYLRNSLGEFEASLVPLVWHLPDGTTQSADVQVLGFARMTDAGPGHLRCALRVLIPAGVLVGGAS